MVVFEKGVTQLKNYTVFTFTWLLKVTEVEVRL